MIVVDIGCQKHGNEDSVNKLVERFKPDVLFGFDPTVGRAEGIERLDGTVVVRSRLAAWTHDGHVGWSYDGIRSGVPFKVASSPMQVPCFDLATWLWPLATGDLVLKLDCEGAEYPLLYHIRDRGMDNYLKLVLVEWHTGTDKQGDFYSHGWEAERPELACPVEEW